MTRPATAPAPMLLAIHQLDDPALWGSAVLSSVLALLVLLGVGWGLAWGGMTLGEGWAPWLGWIAGVAGLAGAVLGGLLLFVPLATAIATLFVDRIAAAVERRHYPWLAPGRPASLLAQAWDGAALALLVLAMQAVALLLSLLVPGLGLLLGWAVAAWAIGRGLFMAVALRRATRGEALALYRARRGRVLAQGAMVAAAGLVPGLNLLAPVLGLAAMVHVLGDVPSPRL